MFGNGSSGWANKLMGLGILFSLGTGSGVLVGEASNSKVETISNHNESPSNTAALRPQAAPSPGTLVLEAVAPAVTPPKPVVKSSSTGVAKKAAQKASASVPVKPQAQTSAGTCDRLDDAKIHWLLGLVAETRAQNPELADGASKVESELKGALGRNLCAAEAQVLVAKMCTDPAVVRFMNRMVYQLPFFVRPLVGDPCKADLVAAANKWMP